ncbi:hypothetical protein, partial [Pedobacter cryophilus]|uniref:hypothetical protein n=1 Tax=Pedobacter cryophilus TaxID=2571271 RepID=UPI00197F9F07
PIITQLAFQEICFVASNTYSLPTLTATDNCSVASVNYVLSGATSRIGTGTDASGTLNTGLTTISWTVTDVNGNVSTSSNDIRIWPLPVLSITPSNADAFCNEVSLTPSSSIPAVAYRWMYNNTLFSSSEVLKLSIANADGNYQLFVTDIHGCVNTQIASYNFQKEGTVSSYTILGIREVKLGENNKVLSGSVGAMGYKGKIDIKKNSSVAAAGAFVKAKSIKVQSPSNVPTKIYAPVVTSLPTMQYFTGSTKNLAKVTANTNNSTLTGNYKELTVKSGKTVTLTGNLFGKIEIEEGATVTFTSSVINIQDLEVEGGESKSKYTPNYTQVIFSTDAIVKVSDKVDIERRSNINPTGKKVIFYVGSMKDHGKYNSNSHDDDDRCPSRGKDHKDDDDDDDDHEGEYGNGEFKVNGGESIVNASVYVPTGKIKVNGGEKSTTSMTGMFIAEKVESSEKNVNWNGFSCSAAVAAPAIFAVNSVNTAKDQTEVSFKLIEEPSKLVAYPNPFARQTTVSFSIPYQEDNAVLDIYDLKGTKIQSLFKG